MPRSLEIIFIILVFSLPAALISILVWPFVMRTPVPAHLDADMATLGMVSVVIGAGITMVLGNRHSSR